MLQVIVSILAPTINCIQLLPQLYKTIKTKKVRDLSLVSILLVLFANLLWLLHGYFILDMSLIIGGMISMTINITLLVLYVLYKKGFRI
jgi:MtN3 and saliva related transmembrane protein